MDFFIFSSILSVVLATNAAEALEAETVLGGLGTFKVPINQYHAALTLNGRLVCGGGIIDKLHVITAAHCLFDDKGHFLENPVTIVSGLVDLHSNPRSKVEIEVKRVHVPLEYLHDKRVPIPGDIAVLTLAKPLNLYVNPSLRKLSLDVRDDDYAIGNVVAFAGFGIDSLKVPPYFNPDGNLQFDGEYSGKIKYMQAVILSSEHCHDVVSGQQFCARAVQNSAMPMYWPTGTCLGDSGGPIVYDGKVIGVLSLGPLDCNELFKGSTYTSTLGFEEFIGKATMDGSCDNSIMYCKEY